MGFGPLFYPLLGGLDSLQPSAEKSANRPKTQIPGERRNFAVQFWYNLHQNKQNERINPIRNLTELITVELIQNPKHKALNPKPPKLRA